MSLMLEKKEMIPIFLSKLMEKKFTFTGGKRERRKTHEKRKIIIYKIE